MLTIFRKEINTFFSSLIGYITIAVFLILMGLIMWVFPDNVLDFGYANLDMLFDNAPMVLILLIPAVTMRAFSEEKKEGTIEIISTRPITLSQIILGKYAAAVLLVLFSLLPTLLYYYSVYQLATPAGGIDHGATIGSYVGLLLLSASFVSIGIFASALTDNQIVAFIVAAFLCFVFYAAFSAISGLTIFGGKIDDLIQSIGIQYHYSSISRGVIDSRDVIYFISLNILFLFVTKTVLESRKW